MTVASLLLTALLARAGTFTATFNNDPSSILNFAGTLWDGSTTTGTGSANWQSSGGAGPIGGTTNGPVSGVSGDGFLQITMAGVNGTRTSSLCGGVLFDDFDHGLIVAGFTFECDLRIGNGNPNPADGFSINYIRTNDPVLVALNAGDTLPQMNGHASPNGGRFADNGSSGDQSLMEEGTLTGLSVGFDMWDSGGIGTSSPYGKVVSGITHDGIGLDIRVDGVLQTEIPMPDGTTQRTSDETGKGLPNGDPNGNNAATDPLALETGPYDGTLSDATLKWVHMKVDMSTSGVLNVYWKNHQILTNFQTSYFPSPGRLLMAARVGGNTANIEVDNIQITTVPANGPVLTAVTATPSYVDLALLDQASITVNTNKPISVVVDGGAAITPAILGYTNNTTTLRISPPTNSYFLMGSTHSFSINLTDSNGSADSYNNKSFTVAGYPFTAVSGANYVIEGPDFNFGGGQFIDNVVLGSTAGSNNYLDKVGLAYIDEYDPAENGANHAYRSYNNGVGEIVGTEPVGATEAAQRSAPGQKYDPAKTGDPSIVPYDVGWVDVGEWYDYTRTFPAGKYKIYCRLANGTGGNFVAQIDAVLSNPATSNQITAPLGLVPGIPTGDWQKYQFFPLVDASGNEVVLPLGGKETYRFTTLSGGLNVEYFSFVPVTNAGTLLPYVSLGAPAVGSSGINPAASISANIVGRDTTLDPSTITLTINGTAVTPQITPNGLGASLTYTPSALYPLGSTNLVQLVYSDKASPPNKVTNQWSFVVISQSQVAFTMPAAFAKPANSGQSPGWNVRVIQEDQSGPQNNDNIWMESILAGSYAPVATGMDTPNYINYIGGGYGGDFGNAIQFDPTFNLVGANNFAMEAITYIALNPGVYTIGARTDDGFNMTTGNYAHDGVALPGATHNGGRGAADNDCTFLVTAAGLYPIRLAYEEGGGGYEAEVFSIDASGNKHLIGNPKDPNALQCYRFSTALPANPVNVTQQPGNVGVEAGAPLTLTVAAGSSVSSPAALLYEWTLSGSHLAYGPTYTIPHVATTDAGTYSCTITLQGYQTSQNVVKSTVTVTPRTDPPTVATALAYSNVVSLQFSEPVDGVSAGTVGNYALSGGLSVTAAALDPSDTSGSTVLLTTGTQTPGTQYTMTITGVKDPAGNVIAANTTAKVTSGYANLTASTQEGNAAGNDWDMAGFWSDGNPASVSAAAEPSVTYELLPGSRMRSSYTVTNAVFPGATLVMDGSGTYMNNPGSGDPTSEIRFKNGGNDWSITFTNLVMNGGQLDIGNTVRTTLKGKMTIAKDAALDGGGGAGDDRGYVIASQLVGTGTIAWYHDSSLLPRSLNNYVLDLNITGTSNTFSGKWNIVVGALLGSAPGSLGTNDMIIQPAGVLETLYDVNNPSGALYLNGVMYLHQNDTFRAVTVADTSLSPGTYAFAQLNAAYPAYFPSKWSALDGSTNTAASGSLKVLGSSSVPPGGPTLTIVKSGGNILISYSTSAAAGFTLQSASSLTKPITWTPVSQTAATSGGVSTVTIPLGSGNQFYQLTK